MAKFRAGEWSASPFGSSSCGPTVWPNTIKVKFVLAKCVKSSGSVKPSPLKSRESAQDILDVINLEPGRVNEGEGEASEREGNMLGALCKSWHIARNGTRDGMNRILNPKTTRESASCVTCWQRISVFVCTCNEKKFCSANSKQLPPQNSHADRPQKYHRSIQADFIGPCTSLFTEFFQFFSRVTSRETFPKASASSDLLFSETDLMNLSSQFHLSKTISHKPFFTS